MDRVPNQQLLQAALDAMDASGSPLTRISTGTRSMQYTTPEGKTVRLRTCNDHVLVVLASSTAEDATLNIEGTDFLLLAMPKTPRQAGPVLVYLLPSAQASRDVRQSHREWLASGPATGGNNKTWNVWFGDGPKVCSGFGERWAKYLLRGTDDSNRQKLSAHRQPLGAVIAKAKADIASAAGVPVESVKISIELT